MLRKMLLLMLGLSLLAVSARAADKSISLELTLGDPESSEMGVLGNAFKQFVEEKSKGAVQIHIAYSGGLGEDESYQFRRVQTGKLDMALGGIGNLVPMVKPLGVVTLPYLFPDTEAVVRGTTGKPAEMLDSYAQKAGLRILAWTYCGFRYISNSKHPITKPEDMRGLRFRVPQSLVMIKTYRAFGGIPSPLAWPMTFNALKHDLVDGQCYDYAGFKAMKFHEAGQRYITEIRYLYNLQPLVISQRVFSKLTPEVQGLLVEAGRHAQALSLQYQKDMSVKARQELQQAGVKIATLADENAWRQLAMQKVWPAVVDDMGGADSVNAYLKVCGLPLWQAETDEKK